MELYKLSFTQEDLADGVLIPAIEENIDYEKCFEDWLENSPDALFSEEANSIIWVARQTSANIGDSVKYPDLLGIDNSGSLVIVELKKNKTPRDTIAQILEYSSWACNLSYNELDALYKKCYEPNVNLLDKFNNAFYPDSESVNSEVFNKNHKLVILAENISPIIRQVVNYLYANSKLKIYCYEYTIFRTSNNEIIVSKSLVSEPQLLILSETDTLNENRWDETLRVKDVVFNAVNSFTHGELTRIFSPSDIYEVVRNRYPNFNKTTNGCQLIADCVNHPSRKHYPNGQQDKYFRVERGKYRLYDPLNDGSWDGHGNRI